MTVLVSATTRPRSSWALGRTPLCRTQLATTGAQASPVLRVISMPIPVYPASWVGSLWWLVALAAASFAVSWLAATRLQMPRTPYIAVLTVTTAVSRMGYIWWLDVTAADLVTSRWIWGLIVAPLAAAVPSARCDGSVHRLRATLIRRVLQAVSHRYERRSHRSRVAALAGQMKTLKNWRPSPLT